MTRPQSIVDWQRMAGLWNRMADLDEQITRCHDEGYAVDVDRLLDERAEWMTQRDRLLGRQ